MPQSEKDSKNNQPADMKVESAEKDRNAVPDSDKIKENDENKDVKESINDDKLRMCFLSISCAKNFRIS